jgi:hypothetical protein
MYRKILKLFLYLLISTEISIDGSRMLETYRTTVFIRPPRRKIYSELNTEPLEKTVT